jgi:hypothetical protein
VDRNDKPNNYVYQYRYIKNNIKTIYRTKGDNKIYHRVPSGWSYEIENKIKIHQNDKPNVASQHVHKVQTNITSKRKISSSKLVKSQELKSDFKSHFVKEKGICSNKNIL